MSDVSGIPNMGFGGGNFFAPQFSYNPQMSAAQASAAYMPAENYAQNVTNNLFSSGGGFGRQTDYYSALGANYLAQVPMSWENPYAGGGVPASLAYPGASLSGGYTTGAANMPSFDTGPGPFGFTSGGAGALDLSRMGNGLFSGGLGSGGGGYSGPSIDWSRVGAAAGGLTNPDPFPGMRMPGGLNSPMSGGGGLDWSTLFGGGGGARAESAPSVSTPTSQTSGASNAPAPPSASPSAPAAMPSSQRLLGYEPGMLPTLPGKSQDQPAFDFSGGNAGWGNAPTATMPSSQRLLGYEPQNTPSTAIDWKLFQSPANDYSTFQGGGKAQGLQADADAGGALTSGGGLTAAELGEQARARLAQLMAPEAKAEIPAPATPPVMASDERVPLPVARPAEADAADPYAALPGAIPLPAERPAEAPTAESPATQAYPGANAPRPSTNIPFTVEPGKEAGIRAVQPRLSAAVQGGAQFLPPGYTVEAYSGAREGEKQAFHRGGRAMDVRIVGPDGPIPSEGPDSTGMYTLLARGVKTWAAQNDPGLLQGGVGGLGWGGAFGTQRAASGGANSIADLMHFDLGGSRGALRPEVQFGNLQPLTEAERNAMPAYIPKLGENQVPLDAPVPRGTGSAYSARFGGDFGGSDVSPPQAGAGTRSPDYWDIPKPNTPEWNAGIYEPMAGGGVMQRPENQTVGGAGQYDDFTRSGNIEDRRTEFLDRDRLAALKARGFGYFDPGSEPAGNPLSAALGLGNLPVPTGAGPGGTVRPGSFADALPLNAEDSPFRTAYPDIPEGIFTGDFGPSASAGPSLPPSPPPTFEELWGDRGQPGQPASRADLAAQVAEPGRVKMDFGGFSPGPEPRSGGVGPQASLEPDFMDVIKEVESSGNPDKVKGSYKGLYQLDDKEFRKYGGTGSIFDPEQNTLAAGAKMIDENQRVQDKLGRELSPVEQYMVHQQGVAGALAHLANPDQLAWKNFQSASGWSDARAKEAVWGNMTPEMKNQFGNDVNNVTSRDFTRLWEDRYYGILNR